jgi:hypothetical protein
MLTSQQLAQVGRPVDAQLRLARTLAAGAFVGGLLATTTTYLAFTGRQRSAAVLGVSVGIAGAVFGGVQLYTSYRDDILQRAQPPEPQAPVLALAGVFGQRGWW